jgi:hypothetical protein
MTEKPPVPSEAELREMRRQAVAYYWADGHFADWVETGEVTDRPDTWDKDLEPLYELLQKQWLAGYHARDAERDANWNAENADLKTLLRNENKLYREASELAEARKARIAELEADERETQRQLDNERINHEATAKYCVELQNRVTELEAEVAELRKQLEQADRELTEEIETRDAYHEAADELAYAIASPEQIGEHTSANSPWKRASALHTRSLLMVVSQRWFFRTR